MDGSSGSGQCFSFFESSYSPTFPVVMTSGITGFRSHYGCGAAGDFHPSSSHPFVPAKGKSLFNQAFNSNIFTA